MVDIRDIQTTPVFREPSDLYSTNDRSYSSWRYADDAASLYSIAEDSREDRTVSDMNSNSNVTGGAGGTADPAGVEVRWLTADEMDEVKSDLRSTDDDMDRDVLLGGTAMVSDGLPNNNNNNRSAAAGGSHNNNNNHKNAHYEPASSFGNRRSRRLIGASICLLFLMVFAVVLPVTLNRAENNNTTRNSGPVTGGVDGGVSGYTEAEALLLAEAYVREAVQDCTPPELLADESTPQGLVFRKLVNEVIDGASYSADGGLLLAFADEMTATFVQEKFALEVLYGTTNGEGWSVKHSWLEPSDPCDWFGILNDCTPRVAEDTCGVVNLNLNSNRLTGTLPVELCCLPCLESLLVVGNSLTGQLPSCLWTSMPTLTTIGLQNNLYTPEQTASLLDVEP